MKISIAVMAHPTRTIEANNLYDRIKSMPFTFTSLVFDVNNDEWMNGEACLRKSNDSEWHVVIQDDAIISDAFYENVCNAIQNVPTQSIISFYTGTVRPIPHKVSKAIKVADERKARWLYSDNLFWGVCIAIPAGRIPKLLEFTAGRREVYDRRIGAYFYVNNLPVYYTYPSIVDHDYKLGSLTGHDHGVEPRRAHRYEPEIIRDWNNAAVQIR